MEIELEVTDSAINKISSVMESEDMPLDKALFRLKVIGQNSTEFEYQMGLEFREEEYTTAQSFFNLDKFDMIIDEKSLNSLNGSVIDYKEDLNAEGFVITNPNVPKLSELEQRIASHLDATINPQIASHGGRIDVIRVDGSILLIEMKGGCQGCSSSGTTLQYGVEQQILSQFPEITRIDDITAHEEGENPYYS